MKALSSKKTSRDISEMRQENDFLRFESGSTVLNHKEMQQVLHDMENPPAGTAGLKEILQTIESQAIRGGYSA